MTQNQNQTQNQKIPKELNDALIERIRKYNFQNISQLLNVPEKESTYSSYIQFEGFPNLLYDDKSYLEYEINKDFDKMKENDIFLKKLQEDADGDYIIEEEVEVEEEEDEIENSDAQNKKSEKKEDDKNLKENTNNKDNQKNDNNNKNNNNNNLIDDVNSNEKTKPGSLKDLLNSKFDDYLKSFEKIYPNYYENHFTKKNQNANKAIFLFKGRPVHRVNDVIINENVYETSSVYLSNQQIYGNIPNKFKEENEEFRLDYNLLEENIGIIQTKCMEYIEMNGNVSRSLNLILSYSNLLEKYIFSNLEPFNNNLNSYFDKISRVKYLISEIRNKTMINSSNLILKEIRMQNVNLLKQKLAKYKNLQKTISSLELLMLSKNYKGTYDLINTCKEEVEKLKIDGKGDPVIDLFENKIEEIKNKNDNQMSDELSQVLNDYFNSFIIITKNEENEKNNYEQYGMTKFICEKIVEMGGEKYVGFISFKDEGEEIKKIKEICDYYVDSNLINNIQNKLKSIFGKLSTETMNKLFEIFDKNKNIKEIKENEIPKEENEETKKEEKEENKEEVKEEKIENDNENNNKDINMTREESENNINDNTTMNTIESNNENENNHKEENTNNENNINNNEKNNDNNENNETENDNNNNNKDICYLFYLLISKKKFVQIILSFIDVISNQINSYSNDIIDSSIKSNFTTECEQIKKIITENTNSFSNTQVQKCLNTLSQNTNIDTFINNFYVVVEMLKEELSSPKTKLQEILTEAQKNFIDIWNTNQISKFSTNFYQNWSTIKEIPILYQKIINMIFYFDLDSNCMKDEQIINFYPINQINTVNDLKNIETEDEEEENEKDEKDEKEEKKQFEEFLTINDGDKPLITIKGNKTCFEIIKNTYELIKMFSLFYKENYGKILDIFGKNILQHLQYQNDKVYDEKSGFEIVSHEEISCSYGIFLLINCIYEHLKDSEFFVTIAKNSDQKLIDTFLDLTTNINNYIDISKKKIEKYCDKYVLKETYDKLSEIELPNYNVVSGDVPVNDYALVFVSNMKNLYDNMSNYYEEDFISGMFKNVLDKFFDKFEDFVFHGKKIEDENCLKQFKRDMIFLKKNLVFITLFDLTDVKSRIDNINKVVLPESMLRKK